MPPSFAKCGVDSGCQSWVNTIVASAARAIAISPLMIGTILAPPWTARPPGGSAKSFWRSTITRAVRAS